MEQKKKQCRKLPNIKRLLLNEFEGIFFAIKKCMKNTKYMLIITDYFDRKI
jgi:hypothetical protein